MKLLLGMVIGWFWCKIFNSQPQNSVPRIKASEQNSVVPITTAADDDEELILETRDVPPAHFLTKIESFSLFSESGIEKYETREFEAGDYKWRLIIYPNGHPSKENNDHVSVYVAMSETNSLPEDWELNAIFIIFLYNQILDKYLCFRVNGVRRFSEAKAMWGFSQFISKKSLRDESSSYLVEDNFVLGAEVFVPKRQRVFELLTLFKPTTQKRAWKIRGFSTLEDDHIWFSEEFTVSDVNWKLEVYPNGHPSSNGKYVSVFLVCVSADSFAPHQKVKADFNIRLRGWPIAVHDSGKISQWFTSSTKSRGLYELISLDWLRHPKSYILVKDCCNIEIEIYVQLVVK